MDQASEKVTGALLQTLNNDENVNVRLAALDALRPYVKNSEVRQDIIRSIAKQQSPLVQVALAELMVELQDKSSVKELEKILNNKKTPLDVKEKNRTEYRRINLRNHESNIYEHDGADVDLADGTILQ